MVVVAAMSIVVVSVSTTASLKIIRDEISMAFDSKLNTTVNSSAGLCESRWLEIRLLLCSESTTFKLFSQNHEDSFLGKVLATQALVSSNHICVWCSRRWHDLLHIGITSKILPAPPSTTADHPGLQKRTAFLMVTNNEYKASYPKSGDCIINSSMPGIFNPEQILASLHTQVGESNNVVGDVLDPLREHCRILTMNHPSADAIDATHLKCLRS
ncbi:hypothetical protein E2C01_000003 [Portunus trituberculatus]|uniref:Uncharacterized protein n=1 Tax=Portunus trituberculatus TaxID=210409 RepID=A0A5B7CDZ3_PORTR|nr:hypothetical protein [Portunus trituberculatus]